MRKVLGVVSTLGILASFISIAPTTSAASSNGGVSIETKLSTNGSLFLTDLTGSNAVNPGQTITVRLMYDNASSTSYDGVSVKGTTPNGFGYVPGTTKNCITPSGSETVCNTDSGQAGGISDSMWGTSNGLSLTISPTAGLYDISPSQTSGILEMGKMRYLNYQNCDYQNNVDYNTDDSFGFEPGNSPVTTLTCGAAAPGTHYRPQNSMRFAVDVMAKRYINMQNCDYQNSYSNHIDDYNTDDIVSFAPGNIAQTSLACGAAASGTHYRPQNSLLFATNHLSYRYLNFQNCDYQNNSDYNTDDVVATNPSNTAQTSFTCGTASTGTSWRPQNSSVLPVDLLDTSRGKGYIEFTVTAPTAAGIYTVSSLIQGSTFGVLQDDGFVEVRGSSSSSSSSSSPSSVSSVSSSASSVHSVPHSSSVHYIPRPSSSSRGSWAARAQCNDGRDNDGDGLKDYPQDPGCSNRQDNNEWNVVHRPKECNDGRDNDGDGRVDMRDPGCANSHDNSERHGIGRRH